MRVDGRECGVDHSVDSLAGRCHARHHRHTEPGAEAVGVNRQALSLGFVDQVERDDKRQPQVDRLRNEIEVAGEVRCVNHRDRDIRTQLHKRAACDRGLGGLIAQAVRARQVDHDRPALADARVADVHDLRGTGIVRRLDADSRERD